MMMMMMMRMIRTLGSWVRGGSNQAFSNGERERRSP